MGMTTPKTPPASPEAHGGAVMLKVDRLIGLCAQCGLLSVPVFCNVECERRYLRWRLDPPEDLKADLADCGGPKR